MCEGVTRKPAGGVRMSWLEWKTQNQKREGGTESSRRERSQQVKERRRRAHAHTPRAFPTEGERGASFTREPPANPNSTTARVTDGTQEASLPLTAARLGPSGERRSGWEEQQGARAAHALKGA